MPTLRLKDIHTDLPFILVRSTSVFNIKDVIKGEYEIDYDVYLSSKEMNLQRPFVWTLHQKQELIISLLKGIELTPMAMICCCFYDRSITNIWRIIDGKQRLSTLISFAKNEFPIIWNGVEYYFKDFDNEAQYRIALVRIKSDVVYEYPDKLISDEWKIKWFDLINFAGTRQDIEHMNKLKS